MSTSATAPIRSLDDPQFEAILEVMFIAASADGDLGEDEKRSFTQIV